MDSLNDIMAKFNIIFLNDNEVYVNEEFREKEHFKLSILEDVEKFIKLNNCKEITNSIFFSKNGSPTPDGLLSNEIFGITKEERSGIFAYIDLGGWFMHPLCYKKWARMDRRVRDIVHGTKSYRINDSGDFVEDPNGKTGIDFIRNNIDKIHIKSTDSEKREEYIKFINKNKKTMFMKKYLVIPAYYRDVNNDGGKVGVGEINKLYNSLLMASKSIKETQDYGLSTSDAVIGRMQEIIVAIYDWFCGNANDQLEGSSGLSKKMGIVKRAVNSKTSDYGVRLVISAPELKVEFTDDILVDTTHSAIPLAAACVNFFPFIIFNVKRFFENEFGPASEVILVDKNNRELHHRAKVKDPHISFSDEKIKDELNKFIYGYSNRFRPIIIPLEETDKIVYMRFKGRNNDLEQSPTAYSPIQSPLKNRRITWCDVFYMAASEAVTNKSILITRYPMDSSYNQFPSKVIISSTKDSEVVFYEGEKYLTYPRIREEDIGSNTSNKFIDTLMLSNLMLSAIGGDYDGDQVSVRGVYTNEANEELMKYMNSKSNYIGFGGDLIRTASHESIQAMYNLTRVLPETVDKLKEIEF